MRTSELKFRAICRATGQAYAVAELKWDQAGNLVDMKLWIGVAGVMCPTGCVLSEFYLPERYIGMKKGRAIYIPLVDRKAQGDIPYGATR